MVQHGLVLIQLHALINAKTTQSALGYRVVPQPALTLHLTLNHIVLKTLAKHGVFKIKIGRLQLPTLA